MRLRIDEADPLAVALTQAIRTGDVESLNRLLQENPGLATAEILRAYGDQRRSLLHVATDWPGNYPNNGEVLRTLIAAGADVNARFGGEHAETPLHWAASGDDVIAVDILVEAGADIEASGAVIGGGTPLADAVGFGQWKAARRLITHGAASNLWQSAALGLMDRVHEQLHSQPAPSSQEITVAFWQACHGNQRLAAELLLSNGAELNWVGYQQQTALDIAVRAGATETAAWLREQGAEHGPGGDPERHASPDGTTAERC
jgi:ankyrin repeat protein